MKRNAFILSGLAALGAGLLAGHPETASGATLCVNQTPKSACYPTIGAAVAAAQAGDTVSVAAGTYKEGVVVGIRLSIVGAGARNSVIDATGNANGVYVDGIDHPNLRGVLVSGFTIENAKFEGILVANASQTTLWKNVVTGNDKSLKEGNPSACPGIPTFETSESDDCGEGIHLLGADHAIVSDNDVANNAGGILISDDTGPTHDNVVTGNTVTRNAEDCGITMASHPPAKLTKSSVPLGVYQNTIVNNNSTFNGLGEPGAGAGVGIFDAVPGGSNHANVVIGNTLTDNGLPGVTMHAHAPGENLDDNRIIGNTIARNHADTEDAATPGTTGINVFGASPIYGTVVLGNAISEEAIDVVANAAGSVTVQLNDLLGGKIGVDNIGAGSVDARDNWWGCAAGPGASGCSSAKGPRVVTTPAAHALLTVE